MFLFRQKAEPADDVRDHEPINVSNASREEADNEHVDNAADKEEEKEENDHVEHDVDDAENEAEQHEEADTPRQSREGTVPPLEEHDITQAHEREVEEEQEATLSPGAEVPGLAMPRIYAAAAETDLAAAAMPQTVNISSNGHSNGQSNIGHSINIRRGSRGATPRGTAGLSPRSYSRGERPSYSGSALSAEEAEVREQQYRRCSSIVHSARNISERRASSVNHLMGNIDGGLAAARRRSGSMTAAEREAVERMMDNEFRRQEAAERSAQFDRVRETALVEVELAKEKTSLGHLVRREKERKAEIGRRSSLRDQRMATAAQRRQELEEQRKQAILESVGEKETRYQMRDPYAVVAAQRRYRSPIAPSRRVSAPAWASDSRRSSGTPGSRAHSTGPDQRRNSASASELRHVKPGIDMSPPKQCLSPSAWKTPEQLKRKQSANAPHRCLPPGAWQAVTVAEHPRQWH
ncbi:hypothetical protein N2W54_000041 [Lotmaria passim]